MNTSISQNYVGVDISKDFLDVHLYPLGKSFKIANTKEEIHKFLKKLKPYNIEQIVCEASGGYDCYLLEIARKNSFNIWQVEPKRIRAFITSEGIKAKTDKIDAQMIALFASMKKSSYVPVERSEKEEHLKCLSLRRADLQQMITMENNRLQHPQHEHTKKYIIEHITFMEREIEKVDAEIEQIITNDVILTTKQQILKSVPGVGKVSIAALISFMPELGKLEHGQIACILGVAPIDNQSGKLKGKSTIKGGRWHLRRIFYMAAVSATRFNPLLKAFYERLRANGKAPKVAIVAVMRKLIIMLNALMRKGETWKYA